MRELYMKLKRKINEFFKEPIFKEICEINQITCEWGGGVIEWAEAMVASLRVGHAETV